MILVVLATVTNAQIHLWRDSFTLFEHTLAVTPPNPVIEYALGLAFAESNRYDEAAPHFEKAVQIRPNDYKSLLYLGISRFHQGRLPEAIEYAQAAIRSEPDSPKAHNLLGMRARRAASESGSDQIPGCATFPEPTEAATNAQKQLRPATVLRHSAKKADANTLRTMLPERQ